MSHHPHHPHHLHLETAREKEDPLQKNHQLHHRKSLALLEETLTLEENPL
jgi:hypothetical protein